MEIYTMCWRYSHVTRAHAHINTEHNFNLQNWIVSFHRVVIIVQIRYHAGSFYIVLSLFLTFMELFKLFFLFHRVAINIQKKKKTTEVEKQGRNEREKQMKLL